MRIGRPRKKCTMFASTLVMGRISAGNNTFLIRLPPAMSEFEDSSSDEENHVQGRMPQNMKSAYGSMSFVCRPGITTAKTNE